MQLEGVRVSPHLEPFHLCIGARQLTLKAGNSRLWDPQVSWDPHHGDWRL